MFLRSPVALCRGCRKHYEGQMEATFANRLLNRRQKPISPPIGEKADWEATSVLKDVCPKLTCSKQFDEVF